MGPDLFEAFTHSLLRMQCNVNYVNLILIPLSQDVGPTLFKIA